MHTAPKSGKVPMPGLCSAHVEWPNQIQMTVLALRGFLGPRVVPPAHARGTFPDLPWVPESTDSPNPLYTVFSSPDTPVTIYKRGPVRDEA